MNDKRKRMERKEKKIDYFWLKKGEKANILDRNAYFVRLTPNFTPDYRENREKKSKTKPYRRNKLKVELVNYAVSCGRKNPQNKLLFSHAIYCYCIFYSYLQRCFTLTLWMQERKKHDRFQVTKCRWKFNFSFFLHNILCYYASSYHILCFYTAP